MLSTMLQGTIFNGLRNNLPLFIFQMTASTQSRVLLENVKVKQSGTYLCEVTVTPGYYALMQFANMTIVGKCYFFNTLTVNLFDHQKYRF